MTRGTERLIGHICAMVESVAGLYVLMVGGIGLSGAMAEWIMYGAIIPSHYSAYTRAGVSVVGAIPIFYLANRGWYKFA